MEPIVKEASGRVKNELRADFTVEGVWEDQKGVFFDKLHFKC